MKDVLPVALIAVLAAGTARCHRGAEGESLYTSIRRDDCSAPPGEVAAPYAARDLGVQQCRAPDMWRLLTVASDANTWIDLTGPGVRWSGEQEVVYKAPIGNFPSIDPSAPVEWRLDARRRPTAVIFRVTAQDRVTLETTLSAQYVVRLTQDGACVIGRSITTEEARALAGSETGCP